MKRLPKKFYSRDTHIVAKDLLGKLLVRTYRNHTYIARICEVECYAGENDGASHARRGKTKRTEVMFGEAGYAYIYLIYGMYNCLNVVTDKKDFPAAVLIRGAIPIEGFNNKTPLKALLAKQALLLGPGKMCREMHITRTLNKENLATSTQLYVADDGFIVSAKNIQTTPRINVDYAGEHARLPWRYVVSI
ncbi:MAG: DNA-3-methyladenine glycosylase [Candidatus Andersenbacteria bacterium]|nr:DNA-3-methyladenine glycosylase [Candidatus Andersenbacteria bacterium]MBI3250642.1 DNA-3-methyladenine glycosylase [Candidatus Andersenbacteria bacterium]